MDSKRGRRGVPEEVFHFGHNTRFRNFYKKKRPERQTEVKRKGRGQTCTHGPQWAKIGRKKE